MWPVRVHAVVSKVYASQPLSPDDRLCASDLGVVEAVRAQRRHERPPLGHAEAALHDRARRVDGEDDALRADVGALPARPLSLTQTPTLLVC